MAYFGFQMGNFTYPGVPDSELFERIAGQAVGAERAGFDDVYVMDHFYQIGVNGPPENAMLEAYTLLGGLAARTSRVRLGTLVTGVTYRNPALLAKVVTTLDVVSSGRAVFGIGAAWNELEHRGYGFEYPPLAERFERLEEALQIAIAMFSQERPSWSGKHYRIDEALNRPRPIRGRIPILIGGSGERKTLKLVARYADMCNLFGGVEVVRHKLEVLSQHCAAEGRDPGTVLKTKHVGLLLNRDRARAEGMLEGMVRSRAESMKAQGMPFDESMVRGMLVAGDPASVAAQLQQYLDAGLDGFTIGNTTFVEDSAFELAAEVIEQLKGAGRAPAP